MTPTPLFALALFACNAGDNTTDEPLDYQGPGSEAWGEVDISCETGDDCLSGEMCADGVCQVEKCTGGLSNSEPPLGKGLRFFHDAEYAVADTMKYEGGYWVDGYDPESNSDYYGSWEVGGSAIADVTGGDFLGTRPERYAAITENDASLFLLGGDSADEYSLSFRPIALDAGDVDGDGIDEAVLVSSAGDTAICSLDTGDCEIWSFSSAVSTLDVAAGDIDGDARAEVVLLIEVEGYRYLYGINPDAEETGQVADWWHYPGDDDDNPVRIAIGDLDGDRVAEVVGLWDDWLYDWSDDSVVVWMAYEGDDGGEFAEIADGYVNDQGTTFDIAVGDTNHDDVSDIYVLAEDAEVVSLRLSGSSLVARSSERLSVSGAPDRLAVGDHDGDAPRASLKSGPEPCEGGVMPMMVMLLPPYDVEYSDGPASVGFGNGESTSETYSDSVSMSLGVDVGVGADFWSIFSAKLSEKVSWSVSNTVSETTRLYMGSRYSISADPDLYGPNYGGVVLSWGCFDSYTYSVDDPAGFVGDVDDEEFVLIVPTGGGVSLWSTTRYNAMAEAVGTLPVIDIPYTVGDIGSYPQSPEKIDGSSLSSDEMLFPNPEKYTVSDVGDTSWWNSVDESQTNSTNMGMDLGASASITVAGVSFGVSASYGWGEGYSLTVGQSAMFNGTLAPIPDDPSTPEDEYAQNRYSVTPYIYLQDYKTADGEDAAFYVMTYTAEQ
jgi:hypothetical protein